MAGSLEQRIGQLEKQQQPEDERFEIVSFPTAEAYRQARERGEIPRFARVYVNVDLDAV